MIERGVGLLLQGSVEERRGGWFAGLFRQAVEIFRRQSAAGDQHENEKGTHIRYSIRMNAAVITSVQRLKSRLR